MGKKTKTPATPDYAGIAEKQADVARKGWQEQLQANRPTQIGPGGSVTWEQDPSGNWTQRTSLDQTNQGLYDTTREKALSAIGGLDTSQIDLGAAPGMPAVGEYSQQAIDAVRGLQQPGLNRRREQQEAKMAAMGMGSGSGVASSRMQQDLSDAETQAENQAILTGLNQGNIEFGQGMDLHNTGVSDILNQRAANLSQVGGLMGLANTTPGTGVSGFTPTGQYATPDYLNAAQSTYGANLNTANAANADKSNRAATVGTIATTALALF